MGTAPIQWDDFKNSHLSTPIPLTKGDVILKELGKLEDLLVVDDANALRLDFLVKTDEVAGRLGISAFAFWRHLVEGLLQKLGVLKFCNL
jgi:hypothetical protein